MLSLFQDLARRLLVALTTPDGTAATIAPREQLLRDGCDCGASPQTVELVLSHFEYARLVIPAPGGLTLAHDKLISLWPTLQRWVDEESADRVLRSELHSDAQRWHVEKDASLLWKRVRFSRRTSRRDLSAALALARQRASALGDEIHKFIEASKRQDVEFMCSVAITVIIVLALVTWGTYGQWESAKNAAVAAGVAADQSRIDAQLAKAQANSANLEGCLQQLDAVRQDLRSPTRAVAVIPSGAAGPTKERHAAAVTGEPPAIGRALVHP
jgi:hypothetical protein